MKKSIKVIIKEKDIHNNTTKKIRKVSLGYAFNYLIPNQIAEIATKGKIKHLNMLENISTKKDNKLLLQNIKIQQDLEQITILYIRKKCSKNNQIFGSISEHDIISRIRKITSINISKKQIEIKSIRQIGKYNCKLIISDKITIFIKLHIVPNKI